MPSIISTRRGKEKVSITESKIGRCSICQNYTDFFIDGVRSNFCALCGESLKGKRLKIEVIEKSFNIYINPVTGKKVKAPWTRKNSV